MDVHKLDRIFKPERIAVIGVTPNPKSPGGTVVRNLVGAGFRGVVYPVNPASEAVLGIQCYPNVQSLPRRPDLGVICAPAAQIPDLVRQCGEAGILGLIIISAGFREAGPEGRELERQLLAEARHFEGMRIIGPNCLGIIVPHLSLNATFAEGLPKKGNVAFISQSGALCTSVLDWAREENIGFSYFVSVGNMADVDFGDLIDYFSEDEKTTSIILYVESISDARKFMTAARAFSRGKPIVAYKAGRFPESAAAAASHTGALAAEDAVYEAAFRRAGIARVFEIGEIFDCAELIGRYRPPQGARLGIVTNAGGPGVMATDALIAAQGELARLSEQTLAALDQELPPYWSHGNPVDILGDARPRLYAKATRAVLDDPGVDAVLVILTPQAMTNPTATAREVAELAKDCPKPILAAWLGGESLREGVRLLNAAGIATYDTPEQGVRAFMTLVSRARDLKTLYETPRDIPVAFTLDRERLRAEFAALLPAQGEVLSEAASKKLLQAYGIPVALAEPAKDADEAAAVAARIGYPVVLKILSPQITHKTDVGGVALNLTDEQALRAAFSRIVASVAEKQPGARIDGVTVQPMIEKSGGMELIFGMKKDPTFGAVLLVGLGGTAAEVFQDRALGFPPLNERLGRWMLESLKSWPLLEGYRGAPGVHLDRLLEVLLRFSYLVADYPEIRELDINPLLATPDGVIALDARVIVDRQLLEQGARPYSHLALRPYPEELVRRVTVEAGPTVTLRPIRPEDEPAWMQMLGRCSKETIYARFRYFFQWASHEAAVRYCFTDYEREIAIVVEQEEEGERSLLGVGRLVADPNHESGEYAVLIVDEWQNRGLGGILLDYCEQIARAWGLKRMVAQTTADNYRMVAQFRNRGFAVELDTDGQTMQVVKELGPKASAGRADA